MPDPIQPAELSALEAVQERLSKGHELLERPQIPPGLVKMWTGSVRGRLRNLFGERSAIYAVWPTADAPFSTGDARKTLTERVQLLDRIVDAVSDRVRDAIDRTTKNRVFIGHGRSPLWRELKDFLQERLSLMR